MFGIGTGEIIAILVITALVIGPEKMVELAGELGRMVGKLRQQTDSMSKEFREALSLEELQEALDEAKREAGELGDVLQGTATEVQEEARQIGNVLEGTATEIQQEAGQIGQAIEGAAAEVQGAPARPRLPAPARAAVSAGAGLRSGSSAPLLLEGELDSEATQEASPFGPSSAQMEHVAPVLIHSALLVPEDREPEDVDIELIEPTVVGPVVVNDEEDDDNPIPDNALNAQDDAGADVVPQDGDGAEPQPEEVKTADDEAIEPQAAGAGVSRAEG
jgi:Sec-independent protein translocase protein TatA